jgi:hypothetical protein
VRGPRSGRSGPEVLTSRWSQEDYRELLLTLTERGVTWYGLAEFAAGHPGIWLRHDVEISLDAALVMAATEAALNIHSDFFLCPESPLIVGDDERLRQWVTEIVRHGHRVGFHLLADARFGSANDRLAVLRARFAAPPQAAATAVTFHAPGIPTATLARVPLSCPVYQRLADGRCRYYSDSTGVWRWGDPLSDRTIDAGPVQLLIHPFWWSGRDRIPSVVAVQPKEVGWFLPQVSARYHPPGDHG